MLPTYKAGDVVLVDAGAYLDLAPSEGDIVLARHPFKSGVNIVKRVRHLTDSGEVYVLGDNPLESSDSRGFGALSPALIIGRVTGLAP